MLAGSVAVHRGGHAGSSLPQDGPRPAHAYPGRGDRGLQEEVHVQGEGKGH